MAGKTYTFYRTSPARTSLVHPTSGNNPLVHRAIVLMLLITGAMGAFVYRLSELQIFEGARNRELAEQNRVRRIPLVADRGTVSDRHGKLLATSQISRYVYLWPRQHSPREWQEIAVHLSPIIGVSPKDILGRLEKAGYTSLLPVRVGNQLSPTMFVAVAELLPRWPGVEILTGSSRKYPNGSLASHVLGYIGEATEEDMARNPDYPSGMIVGKMGIERLANKQLEGKWGGRLVEVDARGQESRLLGEQPPISGEPVQLTLDLALQRTAEKALGGRRGAAVVLNVKTGEVLALASSPTFDPNMFTRSVTEAEWQQLQKGDQPFLNRALQGYPPGSTFKIVTALRAWRRASFHPQARVGTSAFLSVGGHQFWESSRRGFGAIGFRDALAYSSNTFFFRVGMSVGPEAIARWGKALGIGIETPHLGLEGASIGMMPTPDEKEALYNEPWYLGDTISMSIGQGLVQATPLELAVMTAAIANGGKRVQPHLLASQTNRPDVQPVSAGLKPETIKAIQEGLVATVQKGTARRLADGSIPLTAGKTGTSEVGPGRKPNAMYVGYGPVSDPQIAIAVVIENGGYGGVAALPVAHEVFKTYFGKQ
ncbi:penicillin-binding protein 2 [Leptolyngbya sp. O-77]|uniref:penicillin-binding protein 2 n=1 Tax=Leptolyngbya sp. O-77 TaxID=1080068 RepID=UPI00074D2DA1|nr:penicillin-binding protein 2 [Leptolyngbya sp. O-77]BAU42861.1 Beta-lactam-inducible penicillin-binding protein [Leptolyngbya sp. O-77]